MYTGKKKTTITKACSICLDQFSGQDSIQNNFPYSCERFCGQVICITCLKDWFIDSCKNESKMPPRCCCTVPLSAVSHLLSKDQVSCFDSFVPSSSLTDDRPISTNQNSKSGELQTVFIVLFQHAPRSFRPD